MKSSQLILLFQQCGGVNFTAKQLKITPRALYKWIEKGALPRTEYTGETNYSQILSDLSGLNVNEIKDKFKPKAMSKPS